MTADLDALRALVAKATPGPWKVILSPHGPRYNCVQHGEDQNYTSLEMEPGDATLIVAAVNALPALLDELEAARRDAERYRWLRDHKGNNREPHIAQHPYCAEIDAVEYPYFVKVGLDAAIDAARGQVK